MCPGGQLGLCDSERVGSGATRMICQKCGLPWVTKFPAPCCARSDCRPAEIWALRILMWPEACGISDNHWSDSEGNPGDRPSAALTPQSAAPRADAATVDRRSTDAP